MKPQCDRAGLTAPLILTARSDLDSRIANRIQAASQVPGERRIDPSFHLWSSLARLGLEFDVGMQGLIDQVAGFDEGASNVGGAGGQEGFAVVMIFLV